MSIEYLSMDIFIFFHGWYADLINSGWTAEMMFFHGDPAAAVAHELHRRQFILTHMLWFDLGCTAETAVLRISARITQVTGRLRDSTATFTCMGHDCTPFTKSLWLS